MEDDPRERQARLEETIRNHEVCWEVHPVEAKPLGEERRSVGFEVTLAAALPGKGLPDETLSERFERLAHDLRELAHDLREHAGGTDQRSLDIYDATLQEAPSRHYRDEASLKISILHPGERPDPIDDDLRASLDAMEARLRELGASKGRWKEEE